MPDNKRWKGPSPEQADELEQLLKAVPTRTIVQYEWASPEGRAFVKAVRKAQLSMVSLPRLSEALKISEGSLGAAITYWERTANGKRNKRVARQRQPRPLGRSSDN